MLRPPQLRPGVSRKNQVWMPSTLGEVIAERRLWFRRKGDRSRTVRICLGRPVRAPRARTEDPWICPVEIRGLGTRRFQAVPGEDSLQALVLALRYVEMTLRRQGRKAGGRIEWAGDGERPVFAHSFFMDLMEHSVMNLVHGLKVAIDLVEHPRSSPAQRTAVARLERLCARMGFDRRWSRDRLRSERSG